MFVFLTVYLKRPQYALGFLPLLFLCLIGAMQGNLFVALSDLFLSSIIWSLIALTLYISDEKVDTTIVGVDLKQYARPAFLVLTGQACILALSWLFVISGPMPLPSQISFMFVVFTSTFLVTFVGVYLILASLVIKTTRKEIKINKSSMNLIMGDIIKLISQS